MMFTQTALLKELHRLKKFALKLTRNSHDANDLVQSTVLRALEKQHLFQQDTNLFGWMSKIMFTIFVSEYRRKVKFGTQYDPEEYLNNVSVSPTQDVKVELQQVGTAMQRISPDHREILMMICVNGMQYSDASDVLGIPVGTVRSRLSRARENLQAALHTPWRKHARHADAMSYGRMAA